MCLQVPYPYRGAPTRNETLNGRWSAQYSAQLRRLSFPQADTNLHQLDLLLCEPLTAADRMVGQPGSNVGGDIGLRPSGDVVDDVASVRRRDDGHQDHQG